ncbi:hypothetical protein Skr01_31220 [Sphaerisporangium krabiense]|uniref:Uncharacterized protein n=1 Tax=Sphaerisporangium krabiense TaxID=763782 RepID=A0A7W9DP26_9ACTN|nr:hypothetical protein [Sphaerisporangium krabiense]MBB5625629.1 hypothetical protein [Sphaerisporangium krabiense]GII63037.1 hypothetical protein Skr01_31220 [Sphaerisporangium krabiense]
MDHDRSDIAHDAELDETMDSLRTALGGVPRGLTDRLASTLDAARDLRDLS